MEWLSFGLIIFVFIFILILPLLKERSLDRKKIIQLSSFVIGPSLVIYYFIGSPNSSTYSDIELEIDRTIINLEEEIKTNSNDEAIWISLAEAYSLKNQHEKAFLSYEKAIGIENYSNSNTFSDYGEAMIRAGDVALLSQADDLFNRSLELEPNNAKSLFLGGLTSSSLGDYDIAIDRWESLLDLTPPEEARGTLKDRLEEWKSIVNDNNLSMIKQFFVNVDIDSSLIDELKNYPQKRLFLIIRDPLNPVPPLAVTRENVVPLSKYIGNADAMIRGVDLNKYDQLEFVARVSLSGDPLDRSNDISDSVIIDISDDKVISLQLTNN